MSKEFDEIEIALKKGNSYTEKMKHVEKECAKIKAHCLLVINELREVFLKTVDILKNNKPLWEGRQANWMGSDYYTEFGNHDEKFGFNFSSEKMALLRNFDEVLGTEPKKSAVASREISLASIDTEIEALKNTGTDSCFASLWQDLFDRAENAQRAIRVILVALRHEAVMFSMEKENRYQRLKESAEAEYKTTEERISLYDTKIMSD